MAGLPVPAGAAIRVIAPSSPFEPDKLRRGLELLASWGYEVRYDEALAGRATRYLAGSVAQRVDELRAALAEPDTAALWAARGGYGATQLLPHLDTAALRAAGKLLIGFSDITALHLAWHEAGAPALHGPNLTTLADCDEASREHLRRLLRGEDPPRELAGLAGLGRGLYDGRLVGGNLALLAALCGTRWRPATRNAILFLEEIGERPYRLDRMLTQLEQAGWLAGIGGVVLGDFIGCDPPPADGAGYEGVQVAIDFFQAKGVAVAWGFPFGHGPRCHPLPYGGRVSLRPERATLTFV